MKLTRSQLSKFLPDNDTIRAFEELASTAESADKKVGSQILLPAVSSAGPLTDAVSLKLTGNTLYRVEFRAAVTSSGGMRLTLSGPAFSVLSYTSRYPLTSTSETVNHASAYGIPAGLSASSANGMATLDGMVNPSADGILTVQFAGVVSILGGYVRLIRLT